MNRTTSLRPERLCETADPRTATERHLCDQALNTPGVVQLLPKHLPVLREHVGGSNVYDPFASSSCYLLATGRRGAWLHQVRGNGVFFCLHPNRCDHVLVFPNTADAGSLALGDCVNLLLPFGLEITIARVQNHNDVYSQLKRNLPHLTFSIANERYLDWRYPVHTVDTHGLRRLVGGKYQKIRQAINRYRGRVATRQIDFRKLKDTFAIRNIAKRWAENALKKHQHRQLDECNNCFFDRLIDLGRARHSGIYGLLFQCDGRAAGFSIYDAPCFANLFASQVLPGYPYLSEYLTWKTVSIAAIKGCPRLCLGGSENEGMDRFKRKFKPIASHQLASIKAIRTQ